MIKNYLIIAYRHLLKNKIFSLINIMGLAIGMATCILILQYVNFEMSYDQFYKNSENLYRVSYSYYQKNETVYESAVNVPAVGPALKNEFSEVLEFSRLYPFARYQFGCAMMYEDGNQPAVTFNETYLYYADASFITMFSLPFIKGNPETAMLKPYAAVLSESTAKRYFGETDPIGKVMTLNSSTEQHDYIVTGVIRDLPENTHLKIDILLSLSTLEGNSSFSEISEKSWTQDIVYTYVLLSPSTHPKRLETKFPGLIKKYIGNTDVDQTNISFGLQAVEDIYLHSKLQEEIKPGGNIEIVYFLTAVAILILLIAWVNYISLTTSRSVERAKEVSIRKVSGANRLTLVKQFIMESMIVNIASLFFALTFVQLLLPYLHQSIKIPSTTNSGIFTINSADSWLLIVLLICIAILLSGIYPAWLLSSYNPVQTLKGRISKSSSSIFLRKILVVFQFTASISLIIGVFALYLQFNFMQNQDLGVDIHQTLIIKTPANTDSTYASRLISFKEEVQQLSIVKSVTTSSIVPGKDNSWLAYIRREHEDKQAGKNIEVHVMDTDFIESYHLKILAGRDFLVSDLPKDRFGNKLESVIVNEKAVEQLGYQNLEEAIGSIIYWDNIKCVVVGVINNFHQQSLKTSLQPIIFTVNNKDAIYYSVKLNIPANQQHKTALASAISLINGKWNRFFTNYPFDYFFLEDFYHQQYQPEIRFGKVFGIFSGLAILIACLGLFGLSSYTTIQRTKEIGIHKVLGASVQHILTLLTKDFVKLVLIASVIALPFAYIATQLWLANYAYRIEISWWILAAPIATVLIIALLTISLQTIKTALTNPVESLRYE